MALTHIETGKVTYVGCVLNDRLQGQSFYDGYENTWEALVWDVEKGEPRRICTGSTMGMHERAVTDATEEVKAAYAAYVERREAEAREAARIREAKTIARYKDVRVVKGRKVPIGTTGRVFWYGPTQYGYRVGIETASGERMFTAASNVEVILSEEVAA